jgi:hypothetical protein
MLVLQPRSTVASDTYEVPADWVSCANTALSRQARRAIMLPMSIRRVDHVYVASSDPDPLFATLSETLRLPVGWPMDDFTGARSGGVLVGATAIEVIIFSGQAQLPLRERRPTQFRGIAFEPALPDADLFRELDARAIARTEAESVTEKGYSFTTFGLPELLRGAGFVFFCRYHHDEESRRRKILDEPSNREGGIGVIGFEEIVVGAADLNHERAIWQRLLDPLRPVSDRWPIGAGPAVRLIAADVDGIVNVVLRVRSLSGAERILRERGLLGDASQTTVQIDPNAIQGLDVRLTDLSS